MAETASDSTSGLSSASRPSESKPADKRIDVVIAEYNAMRAEITNRTTIQVTLLGTGITAIGIVVGFSVGEHPDRRLLLLVPVIAAIALFLFVNESYRIHVIGDYIRDCQFEYLRENLDPRLPSWEHHVANREFRWWQRVLDAPVDLLLVLAGVVACVFADFPVWRMLLAAPVVVAAGVHLAVSRRLRSLAQPADCEAVCKPCDRGSS